MSAKDLANAFFNRMDAGDVEGTLALVAPHASVNLVPLQLQGDAGEPHGGGNSVGHPAVPRWMRIAHGKRRGQTMAGARERPEHHDRGESPARAQNIHQLPAAGVHKRVGDEKRRLQTRELTIGERNVLPDGLDGNRQSLPVQIANRNRDTDKDSNPPAQLYFLPTGKTACSLPAAVEDPTENTL